jgi:F-type H+-transporting ATPase subunit delta
LGESFHKRKLLKTAVIKVVREAKDEGVKRANERSAGQYAEALIQIALAGKGLDETIARDLAFVDESIAAIPNLKLVLEHPSVASAVKKEMLKSLFTGKIDEMTLRLLELLNDKRRLALLPQIQSEYHELLNARKNILTAKLTCSDPLAEAALANIKARLTEHLGKKLELDVKVDRALIGGFVLKIGDQVIDGSLRGKLNAIEKSLLSV